MTTTQEFIEGDAYSRAVNNMVKYGGGFVSALGAAAGRADMTNRRRLYEAFGPEFRCYADMEKRNG